MGRTSLQPPCQAQFTTGTLEPHPVYNQSVAFPYLFLSFSLAFPWQIQQNLQILLQNLQILQILQNLQDLQNLQILQILQDLQNLQIL